MAVSKAAVLLDTSAIVAIVTQESVAEELLERAFSFQIRALPAPCAAEAILVLHAKLGRDPAFELQVIYRELEIQIVPFTAEHLDWFSHAFARYGKGRHPAALNLGDCFTYAVAKSTGMPLLFTGNDFSRTDLISA